MNLHNWNDLVYLCSKDSINQRIEILSNKFKNFHEHISNQLSNIQMISVYLPIPKNVVQFKQINVLAKVNSLPIILLPITRIHALFHKLKHTNYI